MKFDWTKPLKTRSGRRAVRAESPMPQHEADALFGYPVFYANIRYSHGRWTGLYYRKSDGRTAGCATAASSKTDLVNTFSARLRGSARRLAKGLFGAIVGGVTGALVGCFYCALIWWSCATEKMSVDTEDKNQ